MVLAQDLQPLGIVATDIEIRATDGNLLKSIRPDRNLRKSERNGKIVAVVA